MFENSAVWIWGGLIAVFIALAWYSNKITEQKRVASILEHKGEWGDDMCQWLIGGKYRLTDIRTAVIMKNYGELGQDACQRLLQKKIIIGDSADAVKLAWGAPSGTDEQVISEKDNKFRWIYGVPRKGASYVWFKNGKVTKIKT